MRSKYTLTAIGAVGLALATAVSAYASFDVEAPGAVMSFKTITMPSLDSAPAVEQRAARVKLAWVPQKIDKGMNVERYLVTRYNVATNAAVQVCGDSVTAAKCTDVNVPVGRWKYTVRTVQGTWMGPESKRSDPVKIEGADGAAAATDALVADETPTASSGAGGTTNPPVTIPSSSAVTELKPVAETETGEPTKDPEPTAEPEETSASTEPPAVAEPSPSESSKAAADDKAADK